MGPRLGPGRKDAQEGRALNRIARWCGNGSVVEYEADPRQAENLSDGCRVEGAKPTLTMPGARDWTATDVANDKELAAVGTEESQTNI